MLAARTPSKLEQAIAALKAEDIEAFACPCDISNWASVKALARYAQSLGEVTAVMHIAGMSPHMPDL